MGTICAVDGNESMDPGAARDLLAAVDRAVEIRDRVMRLADPVAGSLAAADASIPHARWVYVTASIALGVAADHLMTWRGIVRSGSIPVHAPMTLLRSALEAAVLTRWVVDDRCDAQTRVARGIAAEIDNHRERGLFEDAIHAGPRPPRVGLSGAERRAELAAARDAAQIPRVALPGKTSLAADYGAPGHADLTWLYRLLSAFAHGKEWSYFGTTMGPPVASPMPGVQRGRVTASDNILVGTSSRVALCVEIAVIDAERYLREP
jgi:hypothetical protein